MVSSTATQRKISATQLLWIAPADLGLLLLILGPALANTNAVTPLTGFLLFVASALFGLVAIFLGIWPLRRRVPVLATISLTIGFIPVATIGYMLAKSHSYPRINDVSTDLDNPPTFIDAAAAPENADRNLSFPDGYKDIIRESYPALISLQIPKGALEAFTTVKEAAMTEPTFSVSRVDDAAMIIEGHASTGLFRFVDDFVIRVQQLENGSQVDMRSRSRVGKGDFGANAKRIAAFFAKIKGSAEEEQALLNEAPADNGN